MYPSNLKHEMRKAENSMTSIQRDSEGAGTKSSNFWRRLKITNEGVNERTPNQIAHGIGLLWGS